MQCVYFDYNATTPLDAEVREAMAPFLCGTFGNPSSVHQIGRKARAALDEARENVASVWGARPSEVIFTSGGTESNNLAIVGAARLRKAKGKHIVTTAIEHHSVLHPLQALVKREGFEVSYVAAGADGVVRAEQVASAIRPDTILVSMMSANNETGAIQPAAAVGKLCQERGILFHCDASQSFGKEPFSTIHMFHADFVTACGHKFHGPKGVGALFIKSPLLPEPLILGGGHENERRAGTENLAGIAGLAQACSMFLTNPVFPAAPLRGMTTLLEAAAAAIPGVVIQGDPSQRLPNTVAFTVEGCESISLLAGLDLEGICASSGSACSAGSLEPSHVLVGMGVSPALANSFVRFSLGRENNLAEVTRVCEALPQVIARIRGG